MPRHLISTLRALRQPTALTCSLRLASSDAKPTANAQTAQSEKDQANTEAEKTSKPKKTLSIAEQDEALRAKMSGLSGDGGEAGIEYENGEPVAMKRSVKNNMFRYI